MPNIGQVNNTDIMAGLFGGTADKNVSGGSGDAFKSYLASAAAYAERASEPDIKKPYFLTDSKENKTGEEKINAILAGKDIIGPVEEITEETGEEKQKRLINLLSILLGPFVSEADIKNAIPSGGIEGNIDSLVSKLEKALEGRAPSVGAAGNIGAGFLKPADIGEILGADGEAAVKEALGTDGFKKLLESFIQGEANIITAETTAQAQADSGIKAPQSPDEVPSDKQTLGTISGETLAAGSASKYPSGEHAAAVSKILEEVKNPVKAETTGVSNAGEVKNDNKELAAKAAIQELIAEARDTEENNLQNRTLNAPKEGDIEKAAAVFDKEKISLSKLNADVAGNNINKTVLEEGKAKVTESLRGEAAAKAEAAVVNGANRSENKSGDGSASLLNSRKDTYNESPLDNKTKENSFGAYLKEAAQNVKGESAKEAAQPYDMRQAKEVSRLIRTMESLAGGKGESRLTVSLNPEHLGRLEIRLVETGGKLTAKFFTDNETSHKMMISHGEVIKSQLAEKGIVIENMDFAFKDASAGQNGNGEGRHSQKSSKSGKNFRNEEEQINAADGVAKGTDPRNDAVYA